MDEDVNRSVAEKGRIEKMTEQNLNDHNAMQASEATRPSMTAQQSSSLPSTPYIHARELLGPYRTPSPINRAAETTSPRTARSESDSTLRPTGRPPLAGCKYETGMAHYKRRIAYAIGGDKLESSPTKVKKHLDPPEEEKLSGDMRELYDRLIPSSESEERRSKFVEKLEKLLRERWPRSVIEVHVFGSSGNLLCTNDSDVDICIITSMKSLERTCVLAKLLAEHGMENVVCVPQAKVPIVKMWDPELKLACDMNVNNSAALNNTKMIRMYVEIDPRVRPLAMIIKYWTRRRILNDAALGGTLSSYTWICMIINFLQTRSPKILPTLQQPPYFQPDQSGSGSSSFADDLEALKGSGKANKESWGDLLFAFFRRYAHEIDYERNVISVREGSLITKQSKKWHLMQNNRLCVEEPFNTERNLGNTADDNAFRGVHLELRRAFDSISQGKLEECCEQYEFPAQEEKFYVRPLAQPRPTLTRSLSQSGRPSKQPTDNKKGSNSGSKHRAGPSNRRASSATAMNKMPPHSTLLAPEHMPPGNQLHDHLYFHFQLLQQQEQHLRLQMHQQAQASLHAQVTAQVQQPLHVQAVPYASQLSSDSHRRHSNMEQPPLSAPLRSMPNYYHPHLPLMTQTSPLQSLSPSLPASQDGTNPPSPSQGPAQFITQDLRRGVHRSVAEGNMGTLRSHSQPPANMKTLSQSSHLLPPGSHNSNTQGSLLGFPTLQQYQAAYLQNKRLAEDLKSDTGSTTTGESSQTGSLTSDPSQDPTSREYVGYYLESGSRPDRFADRYTLAPPGSHYGDPSHARTVSPNSSHDLRRNSRSPSPSTVKLPPIRSINFFTAELANSPPQQLAIPLASEARSRSSGPLIVDGSSETSDYATPPESMARPREPSEAASSLSDERELNTPSTSAVTPIQDSSEPLVLDGSTERLDRSSVALPPTVLQFGEFPVRATFRPSQPHKADDTKSLEKKPAIPSIRKEPIAEISGGLGIDLAAGQKVDYSYQSSGIPQKPLPQSSIVAGLNLASSLKPMTLLSPVREVRTPSPTTTRGHRLLSEAESRSIQDSSTSSTGNQDMASSPLAESSTTPSTVKTTELVDSKNAKGKTKESHHGLVSDDVTKVPHRPAASPQSQQHQQQTPSRSLPQTSGWQQSTSKKKKNKKAHSVGSVSAPPDPNERKGG